jgi:succinate dehydrogenase/fumarate reductase flavoprotein subunit
MSEKTYESGKGCMSRRDLLRTGFAGAAAGSGLALVPGQAEAAYALPTRWDYDVDVVVVGYGGAGACAAITAHDAGAKVMILEKMPEGGGNTRVSGGGILCPTDAGEALTYFRGLYELSHSDMDEECVRMFAERSVDNVAWLTSLKEGTKLSSYGGAGYPKIPGAKTMQKYLVMGAARGPSGGSANLWALLSFAVEEKRKIQVLTESPAQRLVKNKDDEIIGVIATQKGKEIAVRAKRAVVLTNGGYEFDDNTLRNSFKGYPIYSLGNPGNTGDGIRMAQQVGAALWHMNGSSCALGLRVPEFKAGFFVIIANPGFIYVDRDGKRFRNEKSIESHAGLLAVDFYDSEETRYPRIPCYAIFDETTRLKGPISIVSSLGYAGNRYKWSRDNSAEIEKGWIKKGNTVAELAGKLKLEPSALEATVAKWNADMKNGEDTEFHRPVKAPARDIIAYKDQERPAWSAPLDQPPYYAIELWPHLINTQGGPRRNVRAQIIDALGNPIPRLYSAGELGSIWGVIYQGAGNNGESIVFGQIAGRNAAAEKPWA